jgi:AcrR family transcriptional regulator
MGAGGSDAQAPAIAQAIFRVQTCSHAALRAFEYRKRRRLREGGGADRQMGSNGSTRASGGDAQPRPHGLGRATQRERLLDGMARTVARRGYAATPVAEVLKAAGVSRRTFYEQFADKEDCFLAAYDAIVALCSERLLLAYHGGESWEDGIARAYETLLATLASEPDFAHLAVVDVLAAGPRALARREDALHRFARFVDGTHERPEAIVTPPRLVGRAIAGGIHELVYSQIVRGETEQLPRLTGDLLHYTSMLLGAPVASG